MKKLIFALTMILSLSSLAAGSCPVGDPNCERIESGGANAIATGISCEGCASFEKAEGAMLSNNVGVNITKDVVQKTKGGKTPAVGTGQ